MEIIGCFGRLLKKLNRMMSVPGDFVRAPVLQSVINLDSYSLRVREWER